MINQVHIILGAMALSGLLWLLHVKLRSRGGSLLPFLELTRVSPNMGAMFLVLLWFGLRIALQYAPAQDVGQISYLQLAKTNAMYSGAMFIMLLAMVCHGRLTPMPEVGIDPQPVREDFIDGFIGFLLCLLPVYLILGATASLRSEESQHQFLKALRSDARAELMIWIAINAVLLAPLLEELIFRVILQGWLQTRMPAWIAIGISSSLFSVVHGIPDSLALLPMSFVIGYLFYQRHSYWAAVLMHACFNGYNLLLNFTPKPTKDPLALLNFWF